MTHFYSGIDHELEKIENTAAMKSLLDNINTEQDSEFPVDDQSGSQGDEDHSHLDMQLDRLNLKKHTAGQQ